MPPSPSSPRAGPSPADLAAAANRTIPDVLPPPGEQLLVLFCGINPSLYSAATGWHFARPGNRFWPALHLSAFARPRAATGPQPDPLGATPIWVLPNPSGLNASWTLPKIAAAFREVREAAAQDA